MTIVHLFNPTTVVRGVLATLSDPATWFAFYTGRSRLIGGSTVLKQKYLQNLVWHITVPRGKLLKVLDSSPYPRKWIMARINHTAGREVQYESFDYAGARPAYTQSFPNSQRGTS